MDVHIRHKPAIYSGQNSISLFQYAFNHERQLASVKASKGHHLQRFVESIKKASISIAKILQSTKENKTTMQKKGGKEKKKSDLRT